MRRSVSCLRCDTLFFRVAQLVVNAQAVTSRTLFVRDDVRGRLVVEPLQCQLASPYPGGVFVRCNLRGGECVLRAVARCWPSLKLWLRLYLRC